MNDNFEKISHLKGLYQEICLGFSEFKISGKPIFVKHLSEVELGELSSRKNTYASIAVEKKLEYKEDKLIFLIKHELWDRAKEDEIDKLKKTISDNKLILKNLFIKSQVNKIKNIITKAEKDLSYITLERNQALGFCVEDYIDKRYNEDYVLHSFYEDRDLKNKAFNEAHIDETSLEEFHSYIDIINSFHDKFSYKEIKRIAACSFLMNLFSLSNDNAYFFFGKFIKDLTSFQSSLFSQCRYFSNLIQNKADSSPPDDIADDPDKMIDWYELVASSDNTPESSEEHAGIGYHGASQEELQKMAGGKGINISEEAAKKGGGLSTRDFLKMHGI